MPSDHVLQLCTSDETVTAAVAASPHEPISKVAKSLFKSHKALAQSSKVDSRDENDLDRAARCGKFPNRPSDLFLKIYSDVLATVEADPLTGLVSPSLLGSSGVIPLSIVSVIPDIMRHYAELIVRAESEVFIATNYWEPSHSAGLVSNAIRELSKRVQARNGKNVVVKLMYDRGTLSQAITNHAVVKPDGWEKVGLPKKEEIPNVDLEVVNYHRPIVGTFHAKYLIMDRKVACLNSNNIQDRPNVEMMIHLEGPIVDSFYDMALLSWSTALNPPLPLLSNPPTSQGEYQFQHNNNCLKYIDPHGSSKASRQFINEERTIAKDKGSDPGESGGSERNDLISRHPNMTVPSMESSENLDASRKTDGIVHSPGSEAGSGPGRNLNYQNDSVQAVGDKSQTLTPSDNITGGGEASRSHNSLAEITAHLNAGNMDAKATAEDDASLLEDFSPHILHQPHQLFPIAMVNRRPQGTPGHSDPHKVPQNEAWLSAFKNAQQSIFIQTPTFNASPVIPATLDACRRGIQVTLYLDLGFNDQGEMIPFQGGTNEEVINKMYRTLNAEGKHKNLKIYWYTAKDQRKPMSATAKERNCHVKFMAIDDQVAILGNGNQDTQSWFHSQEINVMVDSRETIAEWIKGINANQNTLKFGLVDDSDGVWRDEDGNVVEASGIKAAGPLGRMKGLGGAIARVRGTGGF